MSTLSSCDRFTLRSDEDIQHNMNTQSGPRSLSSSSRSTMSLRKTEVYINVYDILPPGRMSSMLWTIGAPFCHSGVVIGDREYAYGGHGRRGLTGVYWTEPKKEPPGTRLRYELLHGYTFATPDAIEAAIQDAAEAFLGTDYNLLTCNCNHFTTALCLRLTGQTGPSWINRAAGIGLALPCIVPREWLETPDYVAADGELLDDNDDDEDEDDEDDEGNHDEYDDDEFDDEISDTVIHGGNPERLRMISTSASFILDSNIGPTEC